MARTWYDKEEDILNIELSKEEYWKSVELNGMVIDIAKDGSISGIEIPNAKEVFSDVKQVIEQVA